MKVGSLLLIITNIPIAIAAAIISLGIPIMPQAAQDQPLLEPAVAVAEYQPVAANTDGAAQAQMGEATAVESQFGFGEGTVAVSSPALTNPTIPAHAEQLFEGVYYLHEMRVTPRRMSIHVVFVDLETPGLSFFVTPGDPSAELPLNARTTSQFLDEFDLQLAINGDNFSPWHDNGLSDYYPHAGDPVDVPGFASSRGTVYSDGHSNQATLYISDDNQAQINEPIGEVYNAISGFATIVEGGEIRPEILADDSVHPRTSVALDETRRTLILIVIDGRQPFLSLGATRAELAGIAIEHGGYTALNMDGGGTSTLAAEDQAGNPTVLNSPIHGRVPGTERPGGNHLGIYAPRNANNAM